VGGFYLESESFVSARGAAGAGLDWRRRLWGVQTAHDHANLVSGDALRLSLLGAAGAVVVDEVPGRGWPRGRGRRQDVQHRALRACLVRSVVGTDRRTRVVLPHSGRVQLSNSTGSRTQLSAGRTAGCGAAWLIAS
jgi:hypothetical protein